MACIHLSPLTVPAALEPTGNLPHPHPFPESLLDFSEAAHPLLSSHYLKFLSLPLYKYVGAPLVSALGSHHTPPILCPWVISASERWSPNRPLGSRSLERNLVPIIQLSLEI